MAKLIDRWRDALGQVPDVEVPLRVAADMPCPRCGRPAANVVAGWVDDLRGLVPKLEEVRHFLRLAIGERGARPKKLETREACGSGLSLLGVAVHALGELAWSPLGGMVSAPIPERDFVLPIGLVASATSEALPCAVGGGKNAAYVEDGADLRDSAARARARCGEHKEVGNG